MVLHRHHLQVRDLLMHLFLASIAIIQLTACVDGATIIGVPNDRIDVGMSQPDVRSEAPPSDMLSADVFRGDVSHSVAVDDNDANVTIDEAALDMALVQTNDVGTPVDDASQSVPAVCPSDIETTSCIFGLNTRALSSDANFQSLSTTLYTNADELTLLQQRRLVFGFQCEGVFMPDTAESALELTDDGLRIIRLNYEPENEFFEWYRFYMGDTEVGFIFSEIDGQLVALVGDQDIRSCQRSP